MKNSKAFRFYCCLLILVTLFACTASFAQPVLYVATGPSNEIIKINLTNNQVIGKIGELENSHGLAGHPSSEYLVAGSMSQAGAKPSNKPEAVSEEEHEAHHSQNDQTSEESQGSFVSIVHPKHGHVMRRVKVRGITHHTAISPNGQEAVAVHTQAGGISVIDLNTMQVTKFIKTGKIPNYAIFNDTGNKVYISNAGSGKVSKIDTKNWKLEKQIRVGKGPEHLAISPDNNTLYVLNVISGTVSMVNTMRSKTQKKISVGKSPHGITVSPDGAWLYVSNKGSESLTRIDLDTLDRQDITLTPAPYHMEYISEVNKLYVSSRKEPLIWVLDPETLEITSRINFQPGIAHQMVVMDE